MSVPEIPTRLETDSTPLSRGKLITSIELPLERDLVFAFFSNAANLAAITPRELRFQVRTPQPVAMAEGTLIDYTLRFGRLGAIAAPLVRRQLDRIFAFRGERVRQLLLAGNAGWNDRQA